MPAVLGRVTKEIAPRVPHCVAGTPPVDPNELPILSTNKLAYQFLESLASVTDASQIENPLLSKKLRPADVISLKFDSAALR